MEQTGDKPILSKMKEHTDAISIIVTLVVGFLSTAGYLASRIDSGNERTDKVYEIIVRQQAQISGNESKIDSFIEQHENTHWMDEGQGFKRGRKKTP